MDDGRVEVVATGPLHALERLEAALREGPRMSRVDRLEMEIIDPATFSEESFDALF